MLRFADFQKFYGSNLVLEIENQLFESGIYWVKGANGSGKSTLLKTIGGLINFNGDIFLDNISLKKNRTLYRKLINFADAEPIFPTFLTGLEMIALFANAKDATPKQEIPFIESMKMEGYLKNPIGTYSSGMLKKLSLVLAFLGSPKLILLDEPLITMDADSLIKLYGWISAKNQIDGTSFLLSSHQQIDNNLLPNIIELSVANHSLNYPV